MFSFFRTRFLLACAVGCVCATSAQAFILSNPNFQPWLNTASGSRSGNGQPVTLTWSLVDDGTSTPNAQSTSPRVGSNLISFLDGTFGGDPLGGNANDFRDRPWFTLFQQSFDRWEALSGIDYVYEPNDDNSSLAIASGQLGVRGDIRIGGRNVDGASNTLAFNFLPNNGDMVLDTNEASFFGNANGNFRRFRNTVTHELGHGLGLEHVISGTDNLLLEPSIQLSFDGPQLDEVRAVHFYYGDVHEKSNNGLGNGTAARATDLGTVSTGGTVSIGADANVPTQSISSTATDFVSISNINDTDYFSFTITESGLLDVLLTPRGGSFTQTQQADPQPAPTLFDANARSNLALTIFDTNGITPLVTLDNAGLGASELLQDFILLDPGEYFARVMGGVEDTIQLYELEVSIDPVSFLAADFNEDQSVDGTDLAIFESALGINNLGDTDGDGDTDGADFLVWQRQASGGLGGLVSSQAVPEPASVVLLLFGLVTLRRSIRS